MLRPSTTVALTMTAATAIGLTALTWPAGATTATHTLHLTAKRATETHYKDGGFTEADKVRTKAGKTIGTALSVCAVSSQTAATCTGVLGLDGGTLQARFTIDFTNGALSGRITGGTMADERATGTITGTSFNGGSHLTVTYHVS